MSASAHGVGDPDRVQRFGLVVHPARPIDAPLRAVFAWADRHDVEVVQIHVPGQDREVAQPGRAQECDLIIAIGGDGTMLAALRAALAGRRPAMGLACGSLGVLTTIDVGGLDEALDRFAGGQWLPRRLPALTVVRDGFEELLALNDLVIVRDGIGQVRLSTYVDGVLFSRLAGDGCIVCTPLGSSAYSLAAGGALLTPDTEAFLLTPLPTHGGSRQPLVLSASSELALEAAPGIGGARLEVDGQFVGGDVSRLSIRFRPGVATLVGFPEQEPLFSFLRRRQIIVDSPRIVADDGRD